MAGTRFTPASHWSATSIARVLGPMQLFINRSASGGIVLLAATIVAVALANSPWAAAYDALLHTEIGVTVGPFALAESVQHWINDGLMAIFFLLVGLEIKREIMVGELSDLRAAALPIVAALGGVLVPAGIYAALNGAGVGASGWGVPMATDIAFALGCLALLGSRIPFALKIFLTAVAIVDDLIAVLVIALFYSGGLDFTALGIGLGVLVLLLLANRFGIRNIVLYAGLGVIVWLAFLQSGVHATIAGVLIALTVPARNRIDAPTFVARAHGILHHLERNDLAPSSPMMVDETQQSAVIELEELCEQVQAPLQKMEHSLHSWVQLLIMPIFALANAGVALSLDALGGNLPVTLGIVLGLTLGKPIGLVGAVWLAVRSGIATLPPHVTWQHILGAGILAGIGFTMSLFIAALGFQDAQLLATAKIAILIASLIAGSLGLLTLSRAGSR